MRTVNDVMENRKKAIETGKVQDIVTNATRIIAVSEFIGLEDVPTLSDMIVIGGIQQIATNSSRAVQQVGEFGSDYVYTYVDDGQKFVAINRILIRTSLLRSFFQMYINLDETGFGDQQILFDLDHPVFDKPINIIDIITNRDNYGPASNSSITDMNIYRQCVIASNSMPVASGSNQVIESARFLYSAQEEMNTTPAT